MTVNKFSLAPPIDEAINAETDMFGRDAFRDGLINLFRNSASPLVVALDEPWGTGKTVFARRLKNKINDEVGLQAIYFDAFENDHEEDVFIAIASEFLSILEPSEKAKEVEEKAKQVGKVLGRVLLKGGLRLATAGVVKTGDFSESNEEIANEVGDQIEAELDQLIDQKLNNFAKDKAVFKSFRSALKSYASEKPIVFIVDELDRCRPDYALSVLETIKHFFSVNGVHFLLVSNTESLVASIEHQYGNIDGFHYLQKFISLRLTFPVLDSYASENYIKEYVNKCMKSVGIVDQADRIIELLEEFLVERYKEADYSLRTLEKLSFLITLSLNFSNEHRLRLVPIIAILIDLKLMDPITYRKAKVGTLKFSDLQSRYGFDPQVKPYENNKKWYDMWWKYCLDDPSGEEWEVLRSDLRKYSLRHPKDIIKNTINHIVDVLPDQN